MRIVARIAKAQPFRVRNPNLFSITHLVPKWFPAPMDGLPECRDLPRGYFVVFCFQKRKNCDRRNQSPSRRLHITWFGVESTQFIHSAGRMAGSTAYGRRDKWVNANVR